MSRRSVPSTPLSPDSLPDLPDIGDHSEESSDSVQAAAVTSSYSEICFGAEDDLNEDLLPGEIQDLDSVQDATEEITKLVEQLNRGDGNLELDRKGNRNLPKNLPVEEVQVLPTFEAAFGVPADVELAEVAQELVSQPEERIPASNNEIDRFGGLSSRASSLAPTPDISQLPAILGDMEKDARRLANSVQIMMESLSSQLHNVTNLTAECMKTYSSGVHRTCDAADANVKSMYRLLAKYEELSNSVKPVYRVALEVKEVKKLLTQFETLVEAKQRA